MMTMMTSTWAIALILALTFTASAGARERPPAQASPELWRTFARQLPIGSIVKIRTKEGERLTAILFVVDATAITVKPKTRYPEAAKRIAFDQLADLEPQQAGVSYAKYAGVGAAIGASSLLIFWAWAAAQ